MRCGDEQRRTAEQRHRVDAFASIVFAHRAGVDVAGNALAHQDGELPIPAVQYLGQRRARLRIGGSVACYQERTQGTLDVLPQPPDQGVGIGVADAKCVGQFRAVQAVAVGQLHHGAVPVGQTPAGLLDEVGQLMAAATASVPGSPLG